MIKNIMEYAILTIKAEENVSCNVRKSDGFLRYNNMIKLKGKYMFSD